MTKALWLGSELCVRVIDNLAKQQYKISSPYVGIPWHHLRVSGFISLVVFFLLQALQESVGVDKGYQEKSLVFPKS